MNQTRKNSIVNNTNTNISSNLQEVKKSNNPHLKNLSSNVNFYNPLMLNNKPDLLLKNERKHSLIEKFKIKKHKQLTNQGFNLFVFEPETEEEQPNNYDEKLVSALNLWDEKNITDNLFSTTPRKKLFKTIKKVESFMNLIKSDEDDNDNDNDEEIEKSCNNTTDLDRLKVLNSLETLNCISKYKSLNSKVIGGKKYYPYEEKEEASMFVNSLGITRKKFNNNLLK